jgi:hypothetical protein
MSSVGAVRVLFPFQHKGRIMARGGSQLVSDDVASSGMNSGTLISTTRQINDDAETVTGLIGDGGKRSN